MKIVVVVSVAHVADCCVLSFFGTRRGPQYSDTTTFAVPVAMTVTVCVAVAVAMAMTVAMSVLVPVVVPVTAMAIMTNRNLLQDLNFAHDDHLFRRVAAVTFFIDSHNFVNLGRIGILVVHHRFGFWHAY